MLHRSQSGVGNDSAGSKQPALIGKGGQRQGALMVTALLALALSGCATQGGSATGVVGKAAAPAVVSPPAAATTAAQSASGPRPAPALAPPTELELQAGIQIAHIGITAAGGLVDARFKVLDPVKAGVLLANPANAPMLIAGDKPPLMAPHHAIKGSHFAKDQLLMILYPNTRGAVQPGAAVSVALGGTRIGPVTAQ